MEKRLPIHLNPAEKEYRDTTTPVGDGWEVFAWPEYQAFRKRLGIPIFLDETALTIRIAIGERPKITHEYGPREPRNGEPIELTSQHNEKFKTYTPAKG